MPVFPAPSSEQPAETGHADGHREEGRPGDLDQDEVGGNKKL